MRSFSSPLATALASGTKALALGVKVTRKDGAEVRWTTAQKAITVSGDSYPPGLGVELASLPFQLNAPSTRVDLTVVAVDGGTIDPDHLLDGIYDDAQCVIFLVDLLSTMTDADVLYAGEFGQIALSERGVCTVEIKGILGQAYALITTTYNPVCRRDLGDAFDRDPLPGCPVHIKPYETSPWVESAAVASVSGSSVTLSVDPSVAVNWWRNGMAVIRDGQFAGDAFEIRQSSGTSLASFTPVPNLAPGTLLWLVPGCDKSLGPNGHMKFHAAGNPPYADASGPAGDARWFDAEPYAPDAESKVGVFEVDAVYSGLSWTVIDPDLTVTNGSRTVTATVFPGGSTYTPEATGKRYCEMVVDTVDLQGGYVGVIFETDGTERIAYVGTVDTASASPSGQIEGWDPDTNSVEIIGAFSPEIVPGDVIQIATERLSGKVWFGVNGSWFGGGNPATGANPTYVMEDFANPRIFAEVFDTGQQFTANWTTVQCAHDVPDGFLAV